MNPNISEIFGNSNLNNPLFIALDYQGNVVVADDKNNCLKVFDCNTGFLLSTGKSSISKSSKRSANFFAPW